MIETQTAPWTAPNVNAMFLAAWRQYGNAIAMNDGEETPSFNILARRVMALSLFIDEAARGKGPVVLFMPTGRRVVSAFLGALASRRSGLPVDAMPRAHVRDASGIVPPHIYFPDLGLVDPPPSLLLTLRPFERLYRESNKDARYEDLPVLYFDEIANAMDPSHQDRVRERLGDAWLNDYALIGVDETALWAPRPDGWDDETSPLVPFNHGDLMTAVRRTVERWGEPRPKRVLAMTWLDQVSMWTGGYLASIAIGAAMHFIRRFYPAHVLGAVHEELLDVLLMTPDQYRELLPIAEGHFFPHTLRLLADPAPDKELQKQWQAVTRTALHSHA